MAPHADRPIDAIVTDYDLTLTGHGSTLATSTAMLAQWAERGLTVGLASGRPLDSLLEIFRTQGVPFGRPFPHFVVARENFLHWVRDGRPEADEEWNPQRFAELDAVYRAICPFLHQAFAALIDAGLAWRTWNLFCDYGLEFFFATPEEAEQARKVLEAVFRPLDAVRVQRNYWGTNVVARDGGKGYTLRRVADTLAVPPSRILAIGDSLNDLDMLDGRYGFLPGAVGNADAAIKDAVRRAGGIVATRPTGEGVAEIIDKAWQAGGHK